MAYVTIEELETMKKNANDKIIELNDEIQETGNYLSTFSLCVEIWCNVLDNFAEGTETGAELSKEMKNSSDEIDDSLKLINNSSVSGMSYQRKYDRMENL